jgi:hypothetical protein
MLSSNLHSGNLDVLTELVRLAENGESIGDNIFLADEETEQNLHMLAETICQAGDDPETKSAAS